MTPDLRRHRFNLEHHHRFRPLDDGFEPTTLTDEIRLQVIYAALWSPPADGSHIDQPAYYLDRFDYAVGLAPDAFLADLRRAPYRRDVFRHVCTDTADKAEGCLHRLKHLEIYDFARGPDITFLDAASVIHGWKPNLLIPEFARIYSPFDDRAEDLYRTKNLLRSAADRDGLPVKRPLADWVRIAHAHGLRITQELQHATGVTDVLPLEILDGRSPQERQLRSAEKNVARYKERLDAANAKLARFSNRDQDVADATAVVLYDKLTEVGEKALSLREVENLLLGRHIDISHNTWGNQLQRGRAYLDEKEKIFSAEAKKHPS